MTHIEEKQKKERLNHYLSVLRLPTITRLYKELAQQATKNELRYEDYLYDLIVSEYDEHWNKKIQRRLKESKLPLEKRLDTFNQDRIPLKVKQQIKQLLTGDFLKTKTNVLAFGGPGTGKTHLLCSISQELVTRGHRLLFTTSANLVQELLAYKKRIELPKFLKKLLRYEAIFIDDIGYVQQTREEVEVLFTLLAACYEYRSIILTSNLPFSKWEKIFKDPMTTTAAIDRLVHHSMIIELNLPSYRMESAKKNCLENKAI